VRRGEGVPSDDRWEQFDGYDPPRYTPVPDDLFDWQLRDLGLAELKVLLFIIRKTLGYKKNADAISLTQICEATGLGRKAVSQAIRTLEERRAIRVVRRKSSRGDAAINTYVLNIKGQGGSFLRKPPWFPEETTVVSSGNLQEQILQEQNMHRLENESPAVENSPCTSSLAEHPCRPSGDSLSTIQQIARKASQLLNQGRQYQSILGFLSAYPASAASEALDRTLQRLNDGHQISSPIAYFYSLVKALYASAQTATQRRKQQESERLSIACSLAVQLLREWGPRHARAILLDTYHDAQFVDAILHRVTNPTQGSAGSPNKRDNAEHRSPR
jgi:phage replication O-like protein O